SCACAVHPSLVWLYMALFNAGFMMLRFYTTRSIFAIPPSGQSHHEHNPDPQMRPPSIPAEKRKGLLETMIAGPTHIYRYFEPHRRALASIPGSVAMRREEPKIGRNEPCPCGSGRKCKHCCMASSPTFH
ncbi:SEC-C metal-binding domain-containing protein, partial [Paraburkholderia sp. BR13439]|uniref:SEC-C metal-binding domain-containing protein n=1 Tax=Paraburkholderia sp. BR13439 TaxID=3236996 RepID=UPI0034CF928A